MSKSFTEIARHPARFGAILALGIAVVVITLLIARLDTSALHNEGLLEMDGDVQYRTAATAGTGFDAGTSPCPYPAGSTANPVDCIATPAAFDWADTTGSGKGLCVRTVGGDLDGYITEATSPPIPANSDLICQADFIQGDTVDRSYHTGSDKDYQDISDPADPTATDVWRCLDSSNATSKADILNAEFLVTSAVESGDPHQIIYFGAERDAETGDVFNGYWVLQEDISVPPSAETDGQLDCTSGPSLLSPPEPACTTTNSPCNFSGQHVCGDVLMRFNYESGGRIASIKVNQWVAPSPGVTYSPPFNATLGCDQLAGGGAACPAGSPGPVDDCDDDGLNDALDNCTATQQASAESHSVPGGFLCTRPALGGDCRAASALAGADNTDNLCGRVNADSSCHPASQPCNGLELGPGCFSTPWEPKDGSCTAKPKPLGVAPPTFSEVGIDLTGLNLELPCIAALVVESRSSSSIDATLKDFVLAPTGQDCFSSIETDIHAGSNADPTPHTVLTDCTNTPPPPPSCGATGTVVAGATVHDAAFLTPSGPGSAANATGTVTFTLFSNGTCTPGEGNVNVIRTDNVTITDQIAGGIPVNTTGQIESPDFDTSTLSTTVSAISYKATASLDDPYSDPAPSACEPLNVIRPSTQLFKFASVVTTATYTYKETNDGDTPLTNVTVSDPNCTPVRGADAPGDNDNILEPAGPLGSPPAETWVFTCTKDITAATSNTATASGNFTLGGVTQTLTFCEPVPATPTPTPSPAPNTLCDQDERDSVSISAPSQVTENPPNPTPSPP